MHCNVPPPPNRTESTTTPSLHFAIFTNFKFSLQNKKHDGTYPPPTAATDTTSHLEFDILSVACRGEPKDLALRLFSSSSSSSSSSYKTRSHHVKKKPQRLTTTPTDWLPYGAVWDGAFENFSLSDIICENFLVFHLLPSSWFLMKIQFNRYLAKVSIYEYFPFVDFLLLPLILAFGNLTHSFRQSSFILPVVHRAKDYSINLIMCCQSFVVAAAFSVEVFGSEFGLCFLFPF